MRGIKVRILDDAQYRVIQSCARFRAVSDRRQRQCNIGLAKSALRWPQVSGVHPLCPGQGLNVPVLREKRYRRHRFAGEHYFQVFAQRETGTFYCTCSVVGAQFGALHKTLNRTLHGMQQQCRGRHTHHFQGTACLVQVLACNAQCGGIQGGDIGFPGNLRVVHKPAQCLDGTVERLANFVEHPCKWP